MFALFSVAVAVAMFTATDGVDDGSVHKAIEHDNVAVFPTFFTAMDWCETQLIRSVASYEDDGNQTSFWATSHFSRRESFRYTKYENTKVGDA